jgi:hypothetical protein
MTDIKVGTINKEESKKLENQAKFLISTARDRLGKKFTVDDVMVKRHLVPTWDDEWVNLLRQEVEAQLNPEKEPNQNLSFGEAQDFLNENGSEISLEEIVVKSMKERKRWGLSGVSLDDVKQNVAPIPKADLQKLIENSALGSEAHLSVMDTNRTYGENYHEQLYNVFCTHLICDCQSFKEYSKIDSNGDPLDNQKPTEKYRIVFTPQERDLTDDSLPEIFQKYARHVALSLRYRSVRLA